MANLYGKELLKADASLGLLNNVPSTILNKLGNKFNFGKTNEQIEIIILYRDTPEEVKKLIDGLGGSFLDLGFKFGIIKIPIGKLSEVSLSDSIQYIELPKNLNESDLYSNKASCIPQAISDYNVSGKGVLIGFVDSGIDYTHPAFIDNQGMTRIEYIYDLSIEGQVYNKQIIDEALKANDPSSIVPSVDNNGHGTHVAGIACAGGKINPMYYGVAPESSIAMVKASRGVWALSSQIMQGIKFLLDKSKELNMPLVINMSLSTNNGAHNGTSLLEQYIRTIANLERVSIVIAAGNEGDAGHHTGGIFKKTQRKTFNVASDEGSIIINIYKSILPDISINIIGPTGKNSGAIKMEAGYFQGNIGRDRYDIYMAGPKPFELNGEIQIIISSLSEYVVEGTWTLEIEVLNEIEGEYSIWLPVSEGLNTKTKFLEPLTLNTLGIPATVDNIIAVGSYNFRTNNLSTFSGRGEEVLNTPVRPDIVAPGEEIVGPIPGGGYDSKTGTSMATPQIAGICALMTEWGVVNGNDPYLFGQRLKYYLVKAANRSRLDIKYPNPLWGYGTVCLLESFYLAESAINFILAGRNNTDNIKEINKMRKNEDNYMQDSKNTIYEIDNNEFKFKELQQIQQDDILETYLGNLFIRVPKK